jgi:hypothetical protein
MLGDLVVGAVDFVADVVIDVLTGSNDDDEDEAEAGPEENDAGPDGAGPGDNEAGPAERMNDIPAE